MIKKILIGSLLSVALLLSGCEDSAGEDSLAIQQMLDKGDYAGVISALEDSANSSGDYIDLGTAYMGKAGLSLTDILSAMSSYDDTQDDDAFAAFVNSIAGASAPTAFTDLCKSRDFYKKVVTDCTSDNLSDSDKDVCLFMGLSAVTQTAVAIDNLADVSKFEDDSVEDYKLTASICAMQYASGNPIDSDCTVVENPDVTFSFSEKTYTPLTVTTVNGDNYDYLVTTTNQLALTQGYCMENDFSTRVDDYDIVTAPYACPMNTNPDIEECVLLDILNDGMNSIGAVLTEDIQADIDEFKCEILGEPIGCDTAGDITDEDIIEYLDSKNAGDA